MPGPARPGSAFLRRALSLLTGERSARRGLRMLGLGLGMTLGLGIVLILVAVQITSTPHFCGTCHIMKPYYESWHKSKHNQVACVECHIPPGATAEIKKKYEALAMVAKYFTATYGTRLWTEVDDAACLRCHERRLLEGKEVFHGVTFDHTPHLTESRRGLKLRCTSCHSQIVQGSHIAVTVSTCALCHFTGQAKNTGTGRCTTCHQVPTKVFNVKGTRFDHGQVSRLGVECQMCHQNVIRGDGAVPKQNCLSCHSEPARLAKYGEVDFLHKMHVSTHKVDCQRCHLVIEHDRGALPAQPQSGSCTECHGGGHSPQFQLYAGTGGRGVPPMPSPMYSIGVACQGCHAASLQSPVQAASFSAVRHAQAVRANEVACMTCHGSGYGQIFSSWKAGVASRTAAVASEMDRTAAAIGRDSTSAAWGDAQANFLLVREGNGMHNVAFAYALLDKAHDQMNAARGAHGLSALPRPWKKVEGSSNACLLCHSGVESQSGTFAGKAFAHRPHLAGAGLDCAACHRPHAERAPGEIVRFGVTGCTSCHHGTTPRPASQVACGQCHGDVRSKKVQSWRGLFDHATHLDAGAECATCHTMKGGEPRPEKAVCATCHEGS